LNVTPCGSGIGFFPIRDISFSLALSRQLSAFSFLKSP
jgi:hypothetical protein